MQYFSFSLINQDITSDQFFQKLFLDTKTTERSSSPGWPLWASKSWCPRSLLVISSLVSTTPSIKTSPSRISIRDFPILVKIDSRHKTKEGISITLLVGQVIYPGKVTDAPCFRIGNIGHLTASDMEHLLSCIQTVLADMEVPTPVQ